MQRDCSFLESWSALPWVIKRQLHIHMQSYEKGVSIVYTVYVLNIQYSTNQSLLCIAPCCRVSSDAEGECRGRGERDEGGQERAGVSRGILYGNRGGRYLREWWPNAHREIHWQTSTHWDTGLSLFTESLDEQSKPTTLVSSPRMLSVMGRIPPRAALLLFFPWKKRAVLGELTCLLCLCLSTSW